MPLVFSGLLVAVVLACLATFISWRRRLLSQLHRGSEIAETAKGRVEFARVGTGPVILQLHGGAPGYDQPLALSSSLLVRTVLNASEDLDQDKTRQRRSYVRQHLCAF